MTIRNGGSLACLSGCLSLFGLVFASYGTDHGLVGALWAVVALGLTGLLIRRALRMGLSADRNGVVIHNLGRDYRLHWSEVAELTAGPTNNISGAVTGLYVTPSVGKQIVARGTSSYSSRKVKRWLDQVRTVMPPLD